MPLALLLLLATSPPSPCRPDETAVVVETARRSMTLCDVGRPLRRFPVALGAGGVGKRREGDGKTPLGAYPLGSPRPSRSFGTFVPVGYLTPAQRRLGWDGSAVGLHGPPRGLGPASAALVRTDWTAGCIAVATDEEIEAVAAWVRRRGVRAVRID